MQEKAYSCVLPPFERRGTIACDGGGFLKTKPTEQIFVFRSVVCCLIRVISNGTDNARSLRLREKYGCFSRENFEDFHFFPIPSYLLLCRRRYARSLRLFYSSELQTANRYLLLANRYLLFANRRQLAANQYLSLIVFTAEAALFVPPLYA